MLAGLSDILSAVCRGISVKSRKCNDDSLQRPLTPISPSLPTYHHGFLSVSTFHIISVEKLCYNLRNNHVNVCKTRLII
jgi:hypothetical protein